MFHALTYSVLGNPLCNISMFSTLKSGRNDLQKGDLCLCTLLQLGIIFASLQYNFIQYAIQFYTIQWECYTKCKLTDLSYFVVREHVLLQFSSPGTLFLSTISRQSLSLQESAKKKRESPHMLSWSLPQYSHPEEKSWSNTSQEIYNKITKRKW